MKEIRTIKMVEQTEVKFVADDGKEFVGENAERNCRDYERQRDEAKVKEAFERLDLIKISIPILNWYNDGAEIWNVTLNNKAEYFAMTDYLKVIYNCYDICTEMPDAFPCTKTVAVGYDYAYYYSGDVKEELQKALEQLA